MKHSRLISRRVTLIGLCVFASVCGLAYAQQATEEAAPLQLEEIMVTAQKREENIQKASLAVTAVTGENLQALGVTSALDLTQVVPNLTVSQYGNGANVAIRGVVNTNQNETGDPAVAYNLDGVYLARQRAALSGMYDIERVEVLRGPQGTLYGRNAAAGSVNVITNKPDLTKTSASGSIGYGNYNAFQTSGDFNMPLSDTFGFRAALNVEKHEGYVDTTPYTRRFDDRDSSAGRVHLLWKPWDNFSALLTYEVSQAGGAGTAGSSSGAPLGLYASSIGATPYKYATMIGPTYLDQRVNSGTLTLNWSLPLFDVTYVGNHREDNFIQKDSQAIYGPLSSYCKDTSSLNCFHPLTNYSDDRQTSHELRFSKNTERLKSVLGFFYFSEYNTYIQTYEPNISPGIGLPLGQVVRWAGKPDVFEGSKAAFGQASWSLTDQLRLVGGLRYTKDSKREDGLIELGPLGAIQGLQCIGCTIIQKIQGNDSWTKTTWHAGVDYDLGPDSLLFAAVSTGYKAGGFNIGAPPANTPYGPESLTNYELGWKNLLLNHRLQVNIDAYLTNYKDYQATAGTLINGINANLTVNAGTARIKGIELETTFLLTPDDKVSFNATALEAKFTSFYLAHGDGFSPGKNFTPYSLAGKELPYAPHTSVRLGYQHTFALGDKDSLVARVDSGYTSHQWLDYHDFNVIAQDAYTRTGLSLTWDRNSTFSTQLYVHNLENKAILAGVQADTLSPGRDFNHFGKEAYYMPPRTYGLQFRAKF